MISIDQLTKSRQQLHRFLNTLLEKDPAALASFIATMAESGKGTDSCLEHNCLPMPVHYYSPVPNIKEMQKRNIWNRRSSLAGIDFNREAQKGWLLEISRHYGQECKWPRTKQTEQHQFFTANGCFCFGCAAPLHCFIRHFKPRRIMEIGSGNSSLVISEAVCQNRTAPQNASQCHYTIIDPFPGPAVKNGLPGVSDVIQNRVELLDEAFFMQLEANDILFIDSGHTVRTGSDVNFLILDILPRLSPGVLIHFHDIPMPYEYSEIYFTNPSFRMFWTESYLLQAFLACNLQFEIILAMSYLTMEYRGILCQAFPHYNIDRDPEVSGSFWIRKRVR